jgi:hypothetical protein
VALGTSTIKTRLGLTDEELVEQIKQNACLQFFIGLMAAIASFWSVCTDSGQALRGLGLASAFMDCRLH